MSGPSKEEGTSQVDRVLDYLAFVAKSRPLSVLLDEAPRRIARCVDADVASIYLLEGDGGSMVMRGNVGFPQRAKGRIRLALGEGITGRAVQTEHPIFAAEAPRHDDFRSVPGLPEDRFPVLAAVPILGTSGPLGAVVVQRTEDRPFDEAEVSLVAALTAPISSAIRMARLLDDLRDNKQSKAGTGTRKITLPGTPVVRGRAMGAVAALRRPARDDHKDASSTAAELQASLESALDWAERALVELADQARQRELGERGEFLDSYRLMLHDQRLRRRTFELLEDGMGLAGALSRVARDATRAASNSGEDFLIQRARDMEQLCDALLMVASPDARATLPSKAVLLADHVSIYDVLISARTRPVGFVLTERSPSARSKVWLELMDVPALSDVVGAFRWASPGDIALLDADHGLLIVNPSRSDIAAYRAERRREST